MAKQHNQHEELICRIVDQSKKDASTCAVYSATNDTDRKKAIATQSMWNISSVRCRPSVNRVEQIREERIARAAQV